MSAAKKIVTTYAELRDDDVLEDKSGGRWHVSGVSVEGVNSHDSGVVAFWLGDARTKVRMHHMTKPAGDPCTVHRIPTAADDLAALEAGSTLPDPTPGASAAPSSTPDRAAGTSSATTGAAEHDPWSSDYGDKVAALKHDATVAEVEAQLGGTTVVEVTDADLDAARKATDEDPVVLPLFESMTDLEQTSHLFVLHGLHADDLEDRKTRADTHAKAHSDRAQGKLKGRHTPHAHAEKVTV